MSQVETRAVKRLHDMKYFTKRLRINWEAVYGDAR
jgi:hypothetical protein